MDESKTPRTMRRKALEHWRSYSQRLKYRVVVLERELTALREQLAGGVVVPRTELEQIKTLINDKHGVKYATATDMIEAMLSAAERQKEE